MKVNDKIFNQKGGIEKLSIMKAYSEESSSKSLNNPTSQTYSE
jgi:hypothetical protein